MEQWSEDLMMSSYINCKLRQILRQFLWSNRGLNKRDMSKVWGVLYVRAYKIIVWKPEGHERTTHMGNNIKVNIKMRGDVDWMHLVCGKVQRWALVNTVMSLWVPSSAENILYSWETVGFWKMTPWLYLTNI
jgi:hypothetical protein